MNHAFHTKASSNVDLSCFNGGTDDLIRPNLTGLTWFDCIKMHSNGRVALLRSLIRSPHKKVEKIHWMMELPPGLPSIATADREPISF